MTRRGSSSPLKDGKTALRFGVDPIVADYADRGGRRHVVD
jgi:hypothetical protein